ncbi:MAG: phosphoribosyltransferase family protein, partial [Planctomycetota bacterium]
MRSPIEGEGFAEAAGTLVRGVGAIVDEGAERTWAVVGIKSRGDALAERLAAALTDDSGASRFGGRVGALDVTLYRDDLSELGARAQVRATEVDFAIDGLDVVLVDDVLMTGRSVRAALESLADLGRARRVWLAVLADRGGRELPIQPDVVGVDLSGVARGRVA